MHPAFAVLAVPVHHRVAGVPERAVAGAGNADLLGGAGGEFAGAAAHVARRIGDAAAGIGDAATHVGGRIGDTATRFGDAVGHAGIIRDQPSHPETDKGHRKRIGADHIEAALQRLVRFG